MGITTTKAYVTDIRTLSISFFFFFAENIHRQKKSHLDSIEAQTKSHIPAVTMKLVLILLVFVVYVCAGPTRHSALTKLQNENKQLRAKNQLKELEHPLRHLFRQRRSCQSVDGICSKHPGSKFTCCKGMVCPNSFIQRCRYPNEEANEE